jgi:hypothetical protein
MSLTSTDAPFDRDGRPGFSPFAIMADGATAAVTMLKQHAGGVDPEQNGAAGYFILVPQPKSDRTLPSIPHVSPLKFGAVMPPSASESFLSLLQDRARRYVDRSHAAC